MDTDPPLAPLAENVGFSITDNPRPAWSWTRQGKGIGKFRVKVDDGNLEAAQLLVDSLKYTSVDSLNVGTHTFPVQEWIGRQLVAFRIGGHQGGGLGRLLPRRRSGRGSMGGEGYLDETRRIGAAAARMGTGVYRYLLDKTDFSRTIPLRSTDSSFTPDPDYTASVRHNFLVQERDEIGNLVRVSRICSNTGRFSFIGLLGAGDYVLTLAPDSATVGIAQYILLPAELFAAGGAMPNCGGILMQSTAGGALIAEQIQVKCY